ncbi:unnamed protein product, partial [Didymodactylos carnosus]
RHSALILYFITERCAVRGGEAAVINVEPTDDICLPKGWTKQWSKIQEKFYFFNYDTGESIWESD